MRVIILVLAVVISGCTTSPSSHERDSTQAAALPLHKVAYVEVTGTKEETSLIKSVAQEAGWQSQAVTVTDGRTGTGWTVHASSTIETIRLIRPAASTEAAVVDLFRRLQPIAGSARFLAYDASGAIVDRQRPLSTHVGH